MAIYKAIKTLYGTEAKYWTIAVFSIDRVNFRADIQLRGFVSEEAENEGMQPIATKNLSFQFTKEMPDTEVAETMKSMGRDLPIEITQEVMGMFATVSQFGYGLVKTNSEFLDAEDA